MFGPLFSKELIELSRRRRYYFLRVVAGLGVLLLVLNLQMKAHYIPVTASSVGTTAYYAIMARSIFNSWALGVTTGLVLCVPAITCGLVAGEKQSRTFDTLLTTMLTDREILLGKVASRFFVIMWMVASTLPVLAIVSLYGGVDWSYIAFAMLSLVATTLFATALSLYYSTVTDKAYTAQFRTYLFLGVVWYFIPYGIPQLLGIGGVANWLGLYTPFEITQHIEGFGSLPKRVANLKFPGMQPATALPSALLWVRSAPVVLYFLMYAALSWWLFRRTHRNLRRFLVPRGGSRLVRWVVGWFQTLVERARQAVRNRQHLPGLSSLWRWEQGSREWGPLDEWGGFSTNPMMYRNRRANVYDPQHYIMGMQLIAWLGFGCLLVYGHLADLLVFVDQGFHHFMLASAAAVLLTSAALLSAASLAREKQYGSWECLLTTDIEPKEFLLSTIFGVLRRLTPSLMLIGVLIATFGYTSFIEDQLLTWAVLVASLLIYIITAGALVSLSSQRIPEALGKLFALLLWANRILPMFPRSGILLLVFLVMATMIIPVAVLRKKQRYSSATFLFMLTAATVVSLPGVIEPLVSQFFNSVSMWNVGNGINFWPSLFFNDYALRSQQASITHFWLLSAIFSGWFCFEFDRLAGRATPQ